MAETNLAEPVNSTIRATPLAALLESSARTPELVPYRGILTPLHLDATEVETAALTSGAAVHDLGWLRHVAVRGEDRFRWLSGMVTNTVNDLQPNTGAWNLVLNAQGRIQGDLTVWREGDKFSPQGSGSGTNPSRPVMPQLLLEIEADQYDKLMAHLNQFIIMDDVELMPLGEEPSGCAGSDAVIGLSGPLAEDVLARMGLPTLTQPMTGITVEWNGRVLHILRRYSVFNPHYELWLPCPGLKQFLDGVHTAGATSVGCVALDALRIAEGIPRYGVDIVERDLPQETSQTRTLHFNKGCYLGQEIVERIRSRGNVHRHLRSLEISGPVPAAGTELKLENGNLAGQITSAAKLNLLEPRVFALAMMKAEAETPDQTLTYQHEQATGTARILSAPPTLTPERNP